MNGSEGASSTPSPHVDVEFIRNFFRAADEEEVAYRWAWRLGRLLGPRVTELRPETTLSEMLGWAPDRGRQPLDVVMVFQPELRSELRRLLNSPERITFKEMVEVYARWFRSPR